MVDLSLLAQQWTWSQEGFSSLNGSVTFKRYQNVELLWVRHSLPCLCTFWYYWPSATTNDGIGWWPEPLDLRGCKTPVEMGLVSCTGSAHRVPALLPRLSWGSRDRSSSVFLQRSESAHNSLWCICRLQGGCLCTFWSWGHSKTAAAELRGERGQKPGLPHVFFWRCPPALSWVSTSGIPLRQAESTQHFSSCSLQTAIILGCHLCMQRCQRRNLRLIEHWVSSFATLLSSGLCMPLLLNSMQLFSLLSRQRHLVWCSLYLIIIFCFSKQPVAYTAWLPGPLPLLVDSPCPGVRWLRRSCSINREADLWFCFCLWTLTFLTFSEV